MIVTYTQQLFNYGGNCGFRYVLSKAGDRIPMHSHSKEDAHDVYVVQGSVYIFDEDGNSIHELQAGSKSDFLTEAHEIIAAEDNTIIENQYVGGLDWYRNVEEIGFDIITRTVKY